MPMNQEAIDRLDKQRESLRPRPFDLTDATDLARLLRETAEYAQVSLYYGTDDKGRRYASEALTMALRMGFRLVPPSAT